MGVVLARDASEIAAGLAIKKEFGAELLCVLVIVHAPVAGLAVHVGGMVVFNTGSFKTVIGAK